MPSNPKNPVRAKVSKFRRNDSGVAAIEFAMLAPLFFALVFAVIQHFMVMIASFNMESAMEAAINTMQADRQNKRAFTLDGVRQAACKEIMTMFVTSCDGDNLRLSITYAGRRPDNTIRFGALPPLPVVNELDQSVDSRWGDVWLVGMAFDNPFVLPTDKLLSFVTGDTVAKTARTQTTTMMRSVVLTRPIVQE